MRNESIVTEVPPEYVDMLARSVLRVRAAGVVGTAFVVKQLRALTCLHVVAKVTPRTRPRGGWPADAPGDVTLEDRTGRSLRAWVIRTWPSEHPKSGIQPWPDLALLELEADAADLPAVLMDDGVPVPGSRLVLAGYPAKDYVGYQSLRFEAGYVSNYTDNHAYLGLSDEAVDHGYSGGPILAPSGFVVAYARLQRADPGLGGFAIPIAQVLPEAEEVCRAFDSPGHSASEWTRQLGLLKLKERGRESSGSRIDPFGKPPPAIDIDLASEASGSQQRGWLLTTLSEPRQQYSRSVADLGTEVLDAVDQWSRRRTPTNESQVALVGKLLSRLLFPHDLRVAILDRIASEELPTVLRLRVDGDTTLGRLPWEFAAAEADGSAKLLRLAADPRLVFSRYVEAPSSMLPPPEVFRMLVVVNACEGSRAIAEKVRESLREAAGGDDGRFKVVHDQTLGQFEDEAGSGPWHLIHYVGSQPRASALTFCDPYVPGLFSAVDLDDLRMAIRGTGCRVLALQLDDLPGGDPPESNWTGVLGGVRRRPHPRRARHGHRAHPGTVERSSQEALAGVDRRAGRPGLPVQPPEATTEEVRRGHVAA